MILHPGPQARRAASRSSRTVVRHAVKAICEQLETRRLLVTVHGGDTLEMQDYGGIVRVHVDGPSSAQFDLVGATSAPDVDGTNGQTFTLNDIPSTITPAGGGPAINELGGVGGVDGVNPIGTVTGGDSLTDLFGSPGGQIQEAPSAGINFTALSSNSLGKTWGLNLVSTQGTVPSKILELANFDYRNSSDATVYANLAPRIVQLTGAKDTTSIVSVIACDFLPSNDNLLYFAVVVNVPRFDAVGTSTTPTDSPIPFLFTYNFAAPGGVQNAVNFANPNQQEFESQSLPGNTSFADLAPTVLGFSFADNDTLVAFVTGRDITGTGDNTGISSSTGIVSIPDPNNPVFRIAQSRLNPQPLVTPVLLDTMPVDDLHGLEVIPGDDNFVYGISSVSEVGSGPELLHVQLTGPNAGQAIDYGPLTDPQDTRTIKRGQNLGDLDWNPVLLNPFHNQGVAPKRGVLISEDTVTDELVVVDQRERFPETNIFSIYGTNTTADTSISIARVPALTVKVRPMQPFAGDVGPIRVNNAQTGDLMTVTSPAGTGSVFIGALTRNLIPDTINALEDEIPIRRVKKKPSQVFGNLPKSTKYVYAGITIEGDVHNVLIGGTVTGNVDLEGSADLLYAGDWLTGDASGISQIDDLNDTSNGADVVNNVFIHGDVRTFASDSSFGAVDDSGVGKPTYLTGFNMNVGGHLGQITSPNGSFVGSVAVSNTFAGSSAAQQEIEDKRGNTTGAQTYFEGYQTGDAPSLGDLLTVAGGNPKGAFSNDTFATAQYLATAQNNALGSNEVAVVNGTISMEPTITDPVDYYAVGLLAGQSVTVQLSSNDPANVGVFNPDGALIASDRQGIATTDDYVAGQPFRFTADRPGAYRFAVGFPRDADFTGATGALDIIKYTLRLTGLANIALGGVVAGANVVTYEPNIAGISVHTGDLGAIAAAGAILDADSLIEQTGGTSSSGTGVLSTDPYLISRGNLRSIEAPSIGIGTGATATADGTLGDGINFLVPRGSVGLIRATGTAATNVLVVNNELPLIDDFNQPDADYAIGGQYELVDAESEYDADLSADGAIGSIRAAEMTTSLAPTIIANADRAGSDGIIDLIDVTGDIGTLDGGGPHIYTGPGGNVRYMRCGGTVFNSSKFGSGIDKPFVYDPGVSAKLTDDSGTAFKITPTPLVINPNFDPGDGIAGDADQYLNPGQLSVQTYSTDDATKGGVVILNVSIDPNGVPVETDANGVKTIETTPDGTGTPNHGIEFESGAAGNLGSVEIGTIDTFDDGTARQITEIPAGTMTDESGNTVTTTQPGLQVPTRTDNAGDETAADENTPIDLTFKGKSRIDVWSIVAKDKTGSASAGIDEIDNDTDGEIVNVDATGVADIAAEWVGIARSHTGSDKSSADNSVNGVTVLDDGGSKSTPLGGGTPPPGTTAFTSVTTPFVQQRNLIHIHGAGTGYLVTVHARKGVGNIWVEGIIGNIVADSNNHPDPGGGYEGIDGPIVATPGAADTSSDARIEDVNIGQGIAWGGSGDVPLAGIFAGDTIGTIQGSGVGHDIHGIIHAGSNPGTAVSPTDGYSIGTISLKDGAIINASIGITSNFDDWRPSTRDVFNPEINDNSDNPTFDIRQITLKGIGGIIGTDIDGSDIGPIKIEGGFGFLNSEVDSLSDNTIFGIDTTGYGIRGSTFNGGEDMTEMIARGNGKLLSTDSYTPSVRMSEVDGVDPFTGRMPDPLTDLHRYLGTTAAHPKKKSISASGVIENVQANGGRNLGTVSAYQIRGRNGETTDFDFSNAVGTISVLDGTDEFVVNSGSLKKFTTGSDVYNTTIGIAGPITTVNIGGTLRGTSSILATGPEGSISSVHTKHALFGEVNANVGIGTISVGTDLGSPFIATIGNLDLLEVTGSILDGAVVSNFKKNTFVPLRKIGDLEVGGDIQSGSLIRAKAINKQHVGGSINGSIIIGA